MFSLRALLIVVAIAGIFAAALDSQWYVLVSLVAALTVVLLLTAIIAALPSRPYVAFAVTGCGYLLLTLSQFFAPLGAALPTTLLLTAIATGDNPNDEVVTLPSFGERIKLRHFQFVAEVAGVRFIGGEDDQSKRLLVGHCGFALLFAALAEVIARRRNAKRVIGK